jgi:hypothetical protein
MYLLFVDFGFFALRGPVLLDGLFSYQKYHFGYISKGFGMENVCIFYGQLVYFMTVWHSSYSFGIFLGPRKI